MPISNAAIVLGEKLLTKRTGMPSQHPGTLDPQTTQLLLQVLKERKRDLNSRYANAILTGDGRRKMTAFLQLEAKDVGIESGVIDGLWGHVTSDAVEALIHFDTYGKLPEPWREADATGVRGNVWPPQTEAKLIAFYGNVGTNQTQIVVPYPHRIAWEPQRKVTKITCHKKVAPSLQRVLGRVLAHYGRDGVRDLGLDLFGGCLNVRRMRGGTAWSTHAWGIALDYDPENNQLKWGRDRATFAKPAYEKWWQIWEAEGWSSLGRRKNYDWMHVQAARI